MKIECPYCKKLLESVPKRKKKCGFCGEFIYVRDGSLVTKSQADKYDAEQAKEAYRSSLRNTIDFNLGDQGKSENLTYDQVWRILNLKIVKMGKKLDLNSYSNIRYAMACQLDLENRLGQALDFYLSAFYLEINANKYHFYFQPYHLVQIGKTALKIGIKLEQLREAFFKDIDAPLNLPLSPENIWSKIQADFESVYRGETPKCLANLPGRDDKKFPQTWEELLGPELS